VRRGAPCLGFLVHAAVRGDVLCMVGATWWGAPAHALPLPAVSFAACSGQPWAVYVPTDTRFKVNGDGVVSTKRPLTLYGRKISFTIYAQDAMGKRHSARVTVGRHRHRRHHHNHHLQVKSP